MMRVTGPKTAFAAIILCIIASAMSCAAPDIPPSAQTKTLDSWAERCTAWDDWDKPGPPYQVYGDTYYVGTCGITAVLITSGSGHILIDGGTETGADLIAANIEALGFSLSDVKLLLHSHEHFDHVAGLARLQKLSGARLLASPEAAPVLRTGKVAENDPQAGMHDPFPAAHVDGLVNDGTALQLGRLTLNPIATPGHTRGALSWQWQSCEDSRCISIVYADSLSPVSSDRYRFSDHLGLVNKYRTGLDKLAALDCTILLTPHPSSSKMWDRLNSPKALIDNQACKAYSASISKRLDKRIANEKETPSN